MRRRRRGGADPVKELYPFIDDYTWALAQQYEHITIGGVQYPFQDSAKTTPVTANGDPVGAVVGLRQTVDATQPVSADRPVWGANGLVFSSGSRLGILDKAETNFLHSGPSTVIAHVHSLDKTTDRTLLGTSSGGGGQNGVLFIYRSVVDQYEVRLRSAAGVIFLIRTAIGSVPTASHVVAARWTDTGDLCELYIDGVQSGTTATTLTLASGDSEYPLGIGSFRGDPGSGAEWEGEIKSVFAVPSYLSAAEMLTISNELIA